MRRVTRIYYTVILESFCRRNCLWFSLDPIRLPELSIRGPWSGEHAQCAARALGRMLINKSLINKNNRCEVCPAFGFLHEHQEIVL